MANAAALERVEPKVDTGGIKSTITETAALTIEVKSTTEGMEIAGEKGVQLPLDVDMERTPTGRLQQFIEKLGIEMKKKKLAPIESAGIDGHTAELKAINKDESDEVKALLVFARIMHDKLIEKPGSYRILNLKGNALFSPGSMFNNMPMPEYLEQLGFDRNPTVAIVTKEKDVAMYEKSLGNLGVKVREKYHVTPGGERQVSGVQLEYTQADGTVDTIALVFATEPEAKVINMDDARKKQEEAKKEKEADEVAGLV